MRRWSFALILIAVAVYLLFRREQVSVRPVVATSSPVKRAPAQQPLVLAPHARRPAAEPKKIVRPQSVIRLDRQVLQVRSDREPLEVSGRRWRWMTGAVAVPAGDQRVAHVARISERPGFWVIASGDLPPGMEGLPLVEREDNGLLGIFTGVLKALGKPSLESSGQFQSVCPCEIQQSMPNIKSYLLEVSQAQSHEELRTCLKGTGLFKRLEWEILDHPNTSL